MDSRGSFRVHGHGAGRVGAGWPSDRLDVTHLDVGEWGVEHVADLQVDLVAVDRAVWSGRATMVVARTVAGDIGILPGHAPLLAELKGGFAARIQQLDGSILGVAVHGGFLSVTGDGVSILAEDAQLADEIDIQHAQQMYERAKAAGTDSTEAEAQLRHARAQLLAVGQDI